MNVQREEEAPEHPLRYLEDVLDARRPVEFERLLATLQAQGLQQPGKTQVVVAVEMRDQHPVEAPQPHRSHHLPLGAFPAVDEHALAAAHHERAAGTTIDGGDGAGRAQEDEAEVQGYRLRRRGPSTNIRTASGAYSSGCWRKVGLAQPCHV